MPKAIQSLLCAMLVFAAAFPLLVGNAGAQSRGIPEHAAASCATQQAALPPELMRLVLAAYPQEGETRPQSSPLPGPNLMAQAFRCGNAYCSQGTICCFNNTNGRNYCCVRGSRCTGDGGCS